MFGDFDIIIYVAAAVGLFIATVKFGILPLIKEYKKERRKNEQAEQEQGEEINAKNLGNYSHAEVSKYLDGAKIGLQEAVKLHAEQKAAGASPEALKPLEDRIGLLQTVIKYEQPIRMANDLFTKPVVGKIAKGVLGQFL
jgi:hypothetical protein